MTWDNLLWSRYSLYGLLTLNGGLVLWFAVSLLPTSESAPSLQPSCVIPRGQEVALPKPFEQIARADATISELVLLFFHPDSSKQPARFNRMFSSCHKSTSQTRKTVYYVLSDTSRTVYQPLSSQTAQVWIDRENQLRRAFSVRNTATIFYDLMDRRVRHSESYLYNPYVLCEQLVPSH